MSARNLTIYDPVVWDRRNRARMHVENVPLGDVLSVLAQHEGRYVVVELWSRDDCSWTPLLRAEGFLAADQRWNPLNDDDDSALSADIAAYHYDLRQPCGQCGVMTGRFMVDGQYFTGASLQGDSRTDPPKLHVEHRYDAAWVSLSVNLDPGRPWTPALLEEDA